MFLDLLMYPGYAYIIDYFRRLYHLSEQFSIGYGDPTAKVNILPSRTSYFDTFTPFDANQLVMKDWKGVSLPFLFTDSTELSILQQTDNSITIQYDILASAFFFLSGWQEIVYHNTTLAPRYAYSDSLQNKLDITDLPVVNYYFEILAEAISMAYDLNLKPAPWEDAPFAIFPSHDIDTCNTGWKQDAAFELRNGRFFSAASVAYRSFFRQDDWFNFDRILQIEAERNATSTFFFIGSQGKTFQDGAAILSAQPIDDIKQFYRKKRGHLLKPLSNADYNISSERMRSICQLVRNSGSEVGIHGGFTSHVDEELFQKEKSRFNTPPRGNRFHYLYFDRNQTPSLLERVEIEYDSTLGYAEVPGFRNGIVHPFYLWNAQTQKPHSFLELPLIVMDTTFRSYMNTPKEEILPIVKSLFDQTKRFSGMISILWHNNYFSDHKFAGWQNVYEEILDEGNRRGALIASGKILAKRFKKYLAKG
ncbi:MAG: polysaccharide deacetylase family protein [Calditrichota bacterium]